MFLQSVDTTAAFGLILDISFFRVEGLTPIALAKSTLLIATESAVIEHHRMFDNHIRAFSDADHNKPLIRA